MTDPINCEQTETKSSTEDDLESFIQTSSLKVSFYWSYEYCLKWTIPMYPRHSSRSTKASKQKSQRSSSPNKDVPHRLGGKRLRKDIIDLIDSTYVAEDVDKKDEENVQVVVEDDCYSETSSVASGPSVLCKSSARKVRPSQCLCSACLKLYQKAKKMKAPIKNKLLDNDPKSLACDQWVLIKKWRPRKLTNTTGKLLIHVRVIKKRLVKNSGKRTDQFVGEGGPSACSRPHTFLQRNLRFVRLSVKKERKRNGKKRSRDDSQSPRVAKQQRLHGGSRRQRAKDLLSVDGSSGQSSSFGFEGSSEQVMDNPADRDVTVELSSSSISLKEPATKPRVAQPKQNAAKNTAGFRDLLAQLRHNNSLIVRETY